MIKKSAFDQSFNRTVHALMLADFQKRLGRNPLSLFWVFINPMIQVMVLVLIKSAIGFTSDQNISNVLFLISGIVPYFLFQSGFAKSTRVFFAHKRLRVFQQIKSAHIFSARALIEFVISCMVFVILLLLASQLGHPFKVDDFGLVVAAYLSIYATGLGMGLLFAPLVGRFHFMDLVVQIISRILFFTSGFIFPINVLSEPYLTWLSYNPLVHFVELLRDGLFTAYQADAMFLDIPYAMGCMLWIVFIGLVFIKRFEGWAYEKPD